MALKIIVILILMLAAPIIHLLPAQYINGIVRVEGSKTIIPDAQIEVYDAQGKQVETRSDANGHFSFRLTNNLPFNITVKHAGIRSSSTDLIHATKITDTLNLDLAVSTEVALPDIKKIETEQSKNIKLPVVKIEEKDKSHNQLAIEEARRRGWKIYEPSEIENHRQDFTNFEVFLRSFGNTGIRFPVSPMDCYINLRNGRCFTFVVDGEPVGTNWVINPIDIYFMVILQSTESAVEYGDKAPWGAIVIFTRMNGDPPKK